MFESLSEKLKKTLKNLRGQGRLTEEHIDAAMREIRVALLEADVNLKVVRQFIDNIKEKAVGRDVLQALSPHQQVVKIVFEELVDMLGGASDEVIELNFSQKTPSVLMMVGLQGSGKTTSTGKIAGYMKKNMRRQPLLVSVDVYRPAARDQLAVIGQAINIPVFEAPQVTDPLEIVRAAYKDAQQRGFDTLLVDTAGRLHIDDELMAELAQLKTELDPAEILFVADAMIGQDAVKSAAEFHERIGITGVVLTKMDGDARGGAALSVKQVTGQPIKFVGVGEKYDAIEQFFPDRVAQRILGMGDVLSLIEKVQSEVDEEEALRLQQRMMEDKFTLEDYRAQLRQVKNLGPLDKIMGMLPDSLLRSFGMNFRLTAEQTNMLNLKLKTTEAIIDSMTRKERDNHTLLTTSLSRRKRIAKGSGTSVKKIDELLMEYSMMRKMMRQMTRGGMFGGLGGMMGGMPGMMPGMPGMGGGLPAMGGTRGGMSGMGGKKKKGKKKRR